MSANPAMFPAQPAASARAEAANALTNSDPAMGPAREEQF